MRTLRGVAFAMSTAWDAWPGGAALYVAGIVAIAIADGPLSAYALRRIVDGSTMPWVLAPLGAMFLTAVGVVIYGPLQTAASHRIRHELRRRLLAASLEAPGLEHLENPVHADAMGIVRTRAWATSIVFIHLPRLVGVLVSGVAGLVLLWRVHPALAAVATLAAAGGIWQTRATAGELEAIDRRAPDQRLAARIAALATSAEAAKEVRMLRLGGWLVAEHRRLTDAMIADMRRARLRSAAAGVAAGALRGGSVAAGVLLLAWLASRGSTSAGALAMSISLLRSAVQSAGGLADVGTNVAQWAFYSRHLEWLLRYNSPIEAAPDRVHVRRPLRSGIVLQHVGFAYPGTGRRVLDGVDLVLPAGATVAIVGENGAGKTTLVKLLCRFYDPDSGRILVDGVDLRTIDLASWRASATAAFQDFVRFETTAAQAIGAGEPDAMDDAGRVRAAAARGGALELVERLPNGFDTQLGPAFTGGVGLSEGQWQRIALARASMRQRPLLVLLDEPTASLDARAEHDVFERFARMSAEARADGAVTVLVSHRFSTVRMADLIAVLDAGRVTESGTHEELVARGGTYAELYELQASAYR